MLAGCQTENEIMIH